MDYCTVEMNIPRPRGDKAATIRQMLVTSFGYDAEENVPFDTLRARKLVESEDLPSTVKATHHFTPSDSHGAAQSISTRNTSSAINDGTSPSGTSAEAMQPEWVINLPKSLREMYEDEKERKVKHEKLPCLVTSPLREVVVQMHKREGAVIKYLS